ncbi:hypothetical protein [Fusobacterium sp.]|uniref:hypothetical protein n=1 Tax=Fusobacterium sp. TaxID=68766 RepID=UPI002903F2AC|nr:hypothetical protein [Fusobacterium sp.]MDU1910381.1 hypothetical protein [Fusobacterium sp.]
MSNFKINIINDIYFSKFFMIVNADTKEQAIGKAITRYRMRIVKKLGHSEPRINIKDNIIIEKLR